MSLRDSAEPPRPPEDGEEEIIELTDLVEEESLAPGPGTEGEILLQLEPHTEAAQGRKSPFPGADSPAPEGDSLEDFLASLPDLSEDLEVKADPGPLAQAPQAASPPQLPGLMEEDELRALVREVIQETVERLAREMIPVLARQAIDQELRRWKKILSETD